MQLHFHRHGQGKPLIILHGLFGSLENWHSISQKLAVDFNVFAVDQRNHGRSPHAPEMSYELMAQDLKELLGGQHLQTAHILGHSMGGKTAMLFALNYPELLDNLIVADMAPRTYPPAHRHILDALLALDLRAFKNRKGMELQLANSIPELGLRQFLLKNVKRDPAGAFYWQMNLQAIHANYERLNEPLPTRRTFDHPTLFIHGELSDYVRNEDFAQIQTLFPRAENCEIPAAGHWLHVDAPEAFLRTVRDFLRR
jgi:esterase